MGQSHSSILHQSSSSSKRRSLLIIPKKLSKLRRQASCENAGAPLHDNDVTTTQTLDGGENDCHKTADCQDRHNETHCRTPPLPHTDVNVEQQHNDIAATTFSHDPTARDESLIEENLLQQLRELIVHLLYGGDRIDGDIVLEIDSIEKTLKILPQQPSSLVSGDQEDNCIEFQSPKPHHHHQGGGLIIIREHATPSSCDTFFTDAASSTFFNHSVNFHSLTVQKLEQFDIAGEDASVIHNIRNASTIRSNVEASPKQEEGGTMPIVRNGSLSANSQRLQQQQQQSDASEKDKGIFNVSRVKKIELSEIPLATDICTSTAAVTPALSSCEQQQQQKPSTLSSTSTSNGNGSKVLHRVISLTTANHNNDNNNYVKQTKPSFIPEKLQFSAYEKFEGQMLVNWFLQSIPSSLVQTLNENDLNALTMQYCTNLLLAGIIKPLDTPYSSGSNEVFKSNLMYQWTYKEPTIKSNSPGKLEPSAWPHNNNNNSTGTNSRIPRAATSSPKRDGDSKIPKLVSAFTSTPKPRLQSSHGSLCTPENSILLNGIELDQNNSVRIAELKSKLSKCETVPEVLMLIRGFLSEYAMQSSESSTNSGGGGSLVALTNSILNGSDSTIFDKSCDSSLLITTVNNNHQVQQKTTPVPKTPTRPSPPKSRTSPSTPTSLASRQRLRKNNSADSVASTSSPVRAVSVPTCKKCAMSSPTKRTAKRLVDKATVMDVEPITFPKPPETKSVEIQTDPIALDSGDGSSSKTTESGEKKSESERGEEETAAVEAKVVESVAAPAPPAPPPLPPPLPSVAAGPMPPPPPPPPLLSNGPKPPPGPPPAPPMNMSKGPCPLPPPVAVAAPGNKLCPQASSSNSSHSTVNGKPKPAPLPLPASEYYQTNTLRKNAVNPPKPMKPLYWTRIVTPIVVSQDAVDGNNAHGSTEEINEKDELWKEIDETKLDNLDEFTELFSRQCVVPKAKDKTPLPKVKTIKVLDSKRSQNVGIFVRSIHVDFIEIEHAIYECDLSVVSQETLQNIMTIKATNDELTMIKEAIEVHNSNENSIPLDTPEHFLLKLSQISSSAERIACIVFQDEFEEQCVTVSRKVSVVKSLCEFLLENEDLKEVFSIILTLGNFMNGGNRQRGQADGFGLEILGKLKDVKSRDPKITLLHFIVKTYIARSRQNGVAIFDLTLPVPDANDVDKSLSIDFEECKQQLNALKNKLEECRKTTEKVIAESAAEHVQPFKDKMEAFMEMAAKRIESRFLKVEECKVIFIRTLKFYKYTAKKGPLEDTTPAQFFEYWTSFATDFSGIFKKEVLILTNELFKKSRQVTKPQSKPVSQDGNSLKARINRLKNRDK